VHFRLNIGIGAKGIIIILAIVVVFALAGFVIYEASQYKLPAITISGVSLHPDTIEQHQASALNFTIRDNDKTKAYQVQVEFNATVSTLFSINNASLPLGKNGLQYYNMTLEGSQQSTYSFKVLGTLTGGASSTAYSIPFVFFYQNGTRFDTESVSLTVTS